jgi:2-methylisocitrate lyase-like PEP mutase family enzyme
MVHKIRAAVEARSDPNFLIIARTDSYWAWKDPAEVVRRVNAFTEAGADLVFPAGIPVGELKKIRQDIRGQVLMTNRPGASLREEQEAGAGAVLYYGYTLYAAYQGVKTALARLRDTQDANSAGDMLANVDEFERFIGYPEFVARAQRYGLCD